MLAWGRGTYQYLWWWCPDLQERHIRGVSQLRKWPLSEIKVTFWWQKWSVGQYRFPQTVYPIYVASKWGKLVYTKHKNYQRSPKLVSKRLNLKQNSSTRFRLHWGQKMVAFFYPATQISILHYHRQFGTTIKQNNFLSTSRVKFMYWCVYNPCLAQEGVKTFSTSFFTP